MPSDGLAYDPEPLAAEAGHGLDHRGARRSSEKKNTFPSCDDMLPQLSLWSWITIT